MRELSNAEARKMPYYNTKVSCHRTKGDIDGILYEHNVKNKAWISQGEDETLVFDKTLMIGNIEKVVRFRFNIPLFYVMKNKNTRQGRVKVQSVLKDQAWRLFYWHLKSKFEAIEYGLVTLEEELLAHVIINETFTLGHIMTEMIAKDGLQQLALPEPKKENPKEVEAEFTVVE